MQAESIRTSEYRMVERKKPIYIFIKWHTYVFHFGVPRMIVLLGFLSLFQLLLLNNYAFDTALFLLPYSQPNLLAAMMHCILFQTLVPCPFARFLSGSSDRSAFRAFHSH